MTNRLRAGVVGCGSVAQRGVLPHLTLADAQEKVRVVGVADAVGERADATARRFQIPSHFPSLEAMLAGSELDLIIVTTPIPLHFENALTAINAGKHVYVQKTMTTTLAEANELINARDRAGVKLAAAPCYDLFPLTL